VFSFDKGSKAGSVGSSNQNQLAVGIVTDNKDPEGDYRVRVKFPTLPGDDQSWWCRIATFGAGSAGRGMFALPEVDDEVLVAFLHGDFNQPVILATMWNGKDKPPYDNKQGPNNIRAYVSRSGHKLEFNDDKDNKKEKITLVAKSGAKMVIDDTDQAKKIQVMDSTGDNYITLDTQNKKITIETKSGDMLLKAKETIRLEAKNIQTKSDQDTKMDVGANYEMNAQSNFTVKGSAQGTVQATGTLTVKGATVNIN